MTGAFCRDSDVNAVMLAKLIVPFMPVTPLKERVRKLVKALRLAGAGPVNPVLLKSNVCNVVKLPMQDGTVPVRDDMLLIDSDFSAGAAQMDESSPVNLLLLRLSVCKLVIEAKVPPTTPLNRLPDRVAVVN